MILQNKKGRDFSLPVIVHRTGKVGVEDVNA
jgi:hypothetical protein